MSLLVLAYPQLEKKDYDWIQSIRSKHDERYYKLVQPHFTLVFPSFNISDKQLISHVDKVIKKFKEFYFVLRCSQIVKDSFSDYTDVFLVPEEGYRIFVKLHDALYTGVLGNELRLDIAFIPHIGIAGYTDPLKCKKIADEINADNLEIFGSIYKLDVVSYDNNGIKTLKEIFL